MVMRLWLGSALLSVLLVAPAMADAPDVAITIKNHQFVPATVSIPSGTKVKIVVSNQDPTLSEFESVDFHREKVVEPGSRITLYVGPLDPGSYEFFDDFHPDTRGHLVVK